MGTLSYSNIESDCQLVQGKQSQRHPHHHYPHYYHRQRHHRRFASVRSQMICSLMVPALLWLAFIDVAGELKTGMLFFYHPPPYYCIVATSLIYSYDRQEHMYVNERDVFDVAQGMHI